MYILFDISVWSFFIEFCIFVASRQSVSLWQRMVIYCINSNTLIILIVCKLISIIIN